MSANRWSTAAAIMSRPGEARDEIHALRAELATCKEAHMSNCLDADKLRAENERLKAALVAICAQVNPTNGAYRQDLGTEIAKARAALKVKP